jgi:hypothetical protein
VSDYRLDWLGRVALSHCSFCSILALSFRAARLLNCSFVARVPCRLCRFGRRSFRIFLINPQPNPSDRSWGRLTAKGEVSIFSTFLYFRETGPLVPPKSAVVLSRSRVCVGGPLRAEAGLPERP